MPFFRALRHALRALLRAPAFSVVVIVVLGLGIAANTTIFTLVDELLLNPFPYNDPNQLVTLWESNPAIVGIAATRVPVAWSNFEAWRARNRSFQSMEAFQVLINFNLTGFKTPEQVIAANATPGLFPMLGISAAVGRTFSPTDDLPGFNSVAVITEAFARKHFGDVNPVGRSLLLDDVPHTIIGVLPKRFHLPALFEGINEYKPDVWVPLAPVSNADAPQLAGWRRLVVCARLRPGVSLAQAKADMQEIAESRSQEDPALNRGFGVSIFPLHVENTDPEFRNDLQVFSVAALLVLLLACTSLAGLMLVRTAARGRNTAVMAALGAGRWALTAPVLSESFILATIAGIFGFLASYAGVHLVAALKPSDIHAPERLAVNAHAFFFAACASILTVLVFGLIPALLTPYRNLNDALKAGATGETGSSQRFFTRSVLLSIQIAASLTLAIAAALLIRSFENVLAINPGFGTQRLLTGHITLSPKRYSSTADRVRFSQELHDRLQALPGVDSVALVDNMPMVSIYYTSFEIEGRPPTQRSNAPNADYAFVTPDFFRTMNIPLRGGRLFTDRDAEFSPPNAVLINETLARMQWPNQNPVGGHIRDFGANGKPGDWQTIIGVVGDFRQSTPEKETRPELLWPGKAFSNMTVILRTKDADPQSLRSALEKTVWSIDAEQPVSDVQTIRQMVDQYNSQRKFNTLTLGAFAGISILLMLVGMYGLISSFISSHTRDIGIRLALGARRRQVCLSLLRLGMPPALAGIVLGLGLSFLARQLMASVLFGVSALDPRTYVITSVALIAILIATSLGATLRAARIDPVKVLRTQ